MGISPSRKVNERITERRIGIVKMEGETYRTCVDPALETFKLLRDKLSQNPQLKNSIQTIRLDLRFCKMVFWALSYWEESEDVWHFRAAMNIMGGKLRQASEEFKAHYEHTGRRGKVPNLEQRGYQLEKRINKFKRQGKEICILLLSGAFKCKPCQQDKEFFLEYARETASFIDFILENLEALNLKVDLIAPVKQQISFIQGKLMVFGKFAYLVTDWKTGARNFGELISHTQTWANHISCLACLYWIDEMDESLASSTWTLLSDLMQKTMPYTPEVIAMYLDVLKATRYHKFDGMMIPKLLANYVDFLLENLVIPMKDDIEILHDGLIFLLSFVMDQPEEDSEMPSEDGKLILQQIDAIISEVPSLICSIHVDEMKEGIFEIKFSDFLEKIERIKAEVRELYAMTPSQFNSPKTNAIGFLDFYLEILKKMLEREVNFIARVKHGIQIVQGELASLRPFLQNNMELQNEQEELKDLRTRIVNVVYYAAYVSNMCPATSFSAWYGIICLPNVIEEIILVKTELKEIKDHQTCKNKMLSAKMESSNSLPPQATTSKIEGAFIGFREDVRSIIDHLVRGRKDVTVISISGMTGQGKTTLAKRIYNDPSIQYHFHKIVWCYVSKGCKTRELLIKILHDVSNIDVEKSLTLEIQDLAERLWKSLKGKRYLVVMDDIWDVDVWREVQRSFPNDNNGSRILFTSRNHKLASEADPNSISHPLQLFSHEESWELMKAKLFFGDDCTPEFLEIGKQISIYCKGLPLAVALTASLLGRTEKKLDSWNKVAENLKSHLANEGCTHIIELSYVYLPNHLKPCFLYFGAFPRGRNIRAKKLKLLWIAEGFIKENEMRCSEDLAKEYLDNLVSQSLVVVTERSSLGGIKTCNVHDLLYDLCLEKAAEDNFLHSADVSTIVDQCYSSPQNYDHHRLCIGRCDPFFKPRPICTRKELPTSQVHSLLWSRVDSWKPTCKPSSGVFKSFKVLTVLHLEEVFLEYFVFPEEILSLVHLRYLSLWARIDRMPLSIAELWNLETLIVRGDPIEAPLPDTMWKIKSLRHVEIARCSLNLADFEQNNSFAAYNIEALSGPVIPYDHHAEEFFRRLQKLRKLHCSFEGKFHPMWFSMFGSLKKLEALRIGRIGNTGLLFPSEKLPLFNFPENLKKLSLAEFKLPWSAMSTIGKQLPNLEVLKLIDWACEGTTWDLEDGVFSNIRFLKLCQLDVEQLNASSESFPCLEELVVEYCSRLEEIPSSFGDICTLKTIKVFRSSSNASSSARKILEQQEDMGNHSLQVFTPKIFDIDDDNGDEEEGDPISEVAV